MDFTKEQVKMFKDDAESAPFKHGYDVMIIGLCADWLEMAECGEVETLLTLDKLERMKHATP